MSKRKALFSDYDQTFYINDEDIDKNNNSLKRFLSDGNIFVITTGRSYYDYLKKKDKYNIVSNYVILNHGATVIDNNDNVLLKEYIDADLVLKIKEDLILEEADKYFCCSTIDSRVDFKDKDITKIYVRYNNDKITYAVYNSLVDKYGLNVNIYHISSTSIEVVSKKASKLNAIKFLIDKLDVDKKDVYTIGDGYSDLEMIKEYNGCCMKNSINEIKNYSLKEYESVSLFIDDIIRGNINE